MNAAAKAGNGSAAPSRWRQLRYTPLRDVLRGRLSGRLDVLQLIAAGELPAPLGDLVLQVVRRTRLWRSEKVDVARELIAHFQDGIEAERLPAELAQSFGDPVQSARLIRRAKRRNRPLLWRAGRRTLQIFCILVALYAIVAVRMLLLKPTISHDYFADLNRVAAAVPPEQRAWPVYRQALVAMKQTDFLNRLLTEYQAADLATARPGSETYERTAALLQQHQEQIALVRRAALMPGLGFITRHGYSPDDDELWPAPEPKPDPSASTDQPLLSESALTLLLPYLGEMRNLAKVLRHDARRAAAAGDAETALANLLAMRGIAAHAREIPLIINDLVAISILALMFEQAGEILAQQPHLFSDEQLQALAHLIAAIHDRDVDVRLSGERMGFADLIQRLYSDNGRGDGRLTWAGIRMLSAIAMNEPTDWTFDVMVGAAVTPAVSFVVAGRREMMAEYDRLMNTVEAEAAVPLWQRGESSVDQEIASRAGLRWRYLPIDLLLPALSKAKVNGELVMMRRDGMLVAIALELHRRRHGDWPDSLDDLVPSFLPAVPVDRFDGQPLRYLLRDGLPVVYSVGTNRVDDGGEPPPPKADGTPDWSRSMIWIPDPAQAAERGLGDWIIWPPVKPS